MSVGEAVQRWCRVEDDSVPFAVRGREVAELAALVILALAVLAGVRFAGAGPEWLWAEVVVQLALPLGAAWTLRRTTGKRALLTAAILEVGLVVALVVSATGPGAAEPTVQGMVAAGMVWVVASNPRTPARGVLAAATILAIAFVLAAFISAGRWT